MKHSSPSLIGRARELVELRAGLDDALAGRSRLFLLVGEPGIGKTRLAEEIADDATQRGALVLWGRCWEGGGAPAYWPWVQLVRGLFRNLDGAARLELLGKAAGHIAQLIPEVKDALDRVTVPTPTSEHARFALFDAVAQLFDRAGGRQPIVLVFDDLHVADQPSLLLLQFVARELRAARVLIIATYRDVELQRRPECAQIVADVARVGSRLPLSGLSEAEVSQLLMVRSAPSPRTGIVAAVHRVTEGNPLFVDEVARLLMAEHAGQWPQQIGAAGLQIPHGVRDAIRQRLRPLSEACRHVLDVAAVIGRDFDLACLQAITEPSRLLAALSEATVGGLVTADPAAPTRYRFRHVLIRETLYDDLQAGERVELHRQVGEALAKLHAGDPGQFAAIAHHFLRAAPGGDVDRAIGYAQQAGEHAAAQHAYEEAATQFEQALAAFALKGDPQDLQRCDVLLALGEVQLRAGRTGQARAMFQQAAAIARRLDAPTQLAVAALGFCDRGVGPPISVTDPAVVSLAEEALGGLREQAGDSPLRARLLARLASELAVSDPERAIALINQAVALARELGDPITLAHTLSAQHFVLWRSDYLAERLEVATEIMQLGDQLDDPELAIQGRTWRLIDLMGAGEGERFDLELAESAPLAAALRQPRYLWVGANLRAMRALWRGQWTEGIRLAEAAAVLAQRIEDPSAQVSMLVQVFAAHRERGDLGELAAQLPMLQFSAERYPTTPVPRTFLALTYLELGQVAEARAEFELVAREGFADLRRERRLGVLPYLCEVCAGLRDRERAAILYDLLLPYAASTIAYGAGLLFGAATHFLGVLAATLARTDAAEHHFEDAENHFREAEHHFEDALSRHARMGGPAWLARTQFECARMLFDRDATGDRLRALDLARQALATALALDMRRLAQQLHALLADADAARQPSQLEVGERAVIAGRARVVRLASRRTLPSAPTLATPPPAVAARAPAEDTFRLVGQYWTITFGAAACRIKDAKGLRCIHQLLRHPARQFHAFDLDAQTSGAQASEAEAQRASERATRERRIDALRDQFDEAERFNDRERAARVQQEIHLLVDEVVISVAPAEAERARINVTRAIKTAIKRIAEADAALAHHLTTSIRTGARCAYMPDPTDPVRWQC